VTADRAQASDEALDAGAAAALHRGNHRTGALLMSYLLVRDGDPAFVLSVETAPAYFGPSSLLSGTRKGSPR